MQSTEFDELVEALKELASQADDYDDDKGVYPILVSDDGPVLRHAATALAAERDRADRAELELNAVTSLDVDHFTDIWDSLPRVSYTTRVAMAQAAVDLIKQATA